nr:immunoglobulin light chain junction region [Macaca mulatta]MOW16135.1 immunoglobulin light chain junction region [Macaca mulatta]MOW16850.1 immunoglobulin light chain junction region [Macaca mulatta]
DYYCGSYSSGSTYIF